MLCSRPIHTLLLLDKLGVSNVHSLAKNRGARAPAGDAIASMGYTYIHVYTL